MTGAVIGAVTGAMTGAVTDALKPGKCNVTCTCDLTVMQPFLHTWSTSAFQLMQPHHDTLQDHWAWADCSVWLDGNNATRK